MKRHAVEAHRAVPSTGPAIDARPSKRPALAPGGVALFWWLGGCLLAMALAYAAMYDDLGPNVSASTELRYTLQFALLPVYGLAVWLALRYGLRSRTPQRDVSLVIIGAALLRAMVLMGNAPYNPDLGRHIWEGRVLLEGLNPYAAPPSSPVYDGLRARLKAAGDKMYSGQWLTYKDIRTVYGPLATALWALPQIIPGDRVFNLRAVMALLDFCTVLLLLQVWRAAAESGSGEAAGKAGFAARLPQTTVIIYAWSPVTISSFADRGQVDAAMVFFLVLTALLALRRRPMLTGVAFACACLVKISPVLFVLPLARFCGWRMLVGFAATMLGGMLPFVGAGTAGLSGFLTFSDQWINSDSVCSLTGHMLYWLHITSEPNRPTRVLMAVAALGYAVWRTVRLKPGDGLGLLNALIAIAAAVIIFSPVTFPWYATTLAALLCFGPSPSLVVLTLVPMGWFLDFIKPASTSLWMWVVRTDQYIGQAWRFPFYGVFYLLLLRETILGRRRRLNAGAGVATR